MRTQPVRYRYPGRPPMCGGGVNAQREALLVFLYTDSGLVGIGEAGVAGGPPVSTRTVVEHGACGSAVTIRRVERATG